MLSNSMATANIGKILTTVAVATYILAIVTKIIQGVTKLTFSLIVQIVGILTLSLSVDYTELLPWKHAVVVIATLMALYHLPSRHLPVNNKAVLITGCDTGIGHELAIQLDKLGFYVYAGCLDNNGEGQSKLKEACSDRLTTIQLDVSDVTQVQQAAKEVTMAISAKGQELWGVVNNAGICYVGNVEMMTSDDMQRVVSVNYMGPVNVCKHFLPLLRRSKGRIVNVASNAGLAPVPLMGVYCASKSALATMTEVWRYEFKPWGIKVATIIPSGYRTGIMKYDRQAAGERWWREASDTVKQDYGKDCFYIRFKADNHESFLSAQFTELIDNVTDALLSTSPKSYYYSGFLSKALPFIYLHLPTWLSDPIMSVLVNWFEFKPKMLYSQREKKQG
ncbi:hypothetical protein FSP39_006862 [Pinctada imbricata]|uniref:Estradiol 17-beta-dehydrogenase 2 n=1 Tax=Pinctada imbricata TaxID=66713 RepID=A0AA89C5K0_PINIB|nr:hypothetical protein FSP39_006862 [Pinctada imbricata]